MKLSELYKIIDSIAPFSSQSEWDNSGLLIGSPDTQIGKIGFALDATAEVIEDAASKGCGAVVTHHPVIFNPLSHIDENDPAYLAVKHGIAIISSHTPFDKSNPGVNTVLCEKLGLENIRLMDTDEEGLCRIGELPAAVSEKEFSRIITDALGGGVVYSSCGNEIKTVAVCGGAGGEFFECAKRAGADAFVTGEAKHHMFLGAKAAGISLYAAGHYDTEAPAVEILKELCEKQTDAECIMLSQPRTTEFTGAK